MIFVVVHNGGNFAINLCAQFKDEEEDVARAYAKVIMHEYPRLLADLMQGETLKEAFVKGGIHVS